eukprot:11347321-Alexandrium_andersonii.AAC.1
MHVEPAMAGVPRTVTALSGAAATTWNQCVPGAAALAGVVGRWASRTGPAENAKGSGSGSIGDASPPLCCCKTTAVGGAAA